MKKVSVKGVIIPNDYKWIYDYFEMESTCPNDVQKVLDEANGEEIEVLINSGGGAVSAGSEIYTILKEYKGQTTGKILGIAASAASVIAMGVDKLLISPTARMMIHKASISWTGGNADDLQKDINMLNSADRAIANSYMLKTGLSQEELLEMMSRETWLDPQMAIEKGFADEIMFAENNNMVTNIELDSNGMIPKQIIDKMVNERAKQKKEELALAKAKLELAISL
jgi:ATP-dependent Clp protease protease subunit